mgnify:FL=1
MTDSPTQLHDGDRGSLLAPVRQALALLIKGPFVSATKTPEVFSTISAHRETLAAQLDNLFLSLVIDDAAGVAYAKAWDEEHDDQRALFRKHPLTFMDTVVLLHLRHTLVLTNPTERAVVSEDEVFEATLPYQGAEGTDKAASRKKFTATWNKLRNNSIITSTTSEGRFEVSPVLRVVFSPEDIAAVTAAYQEILGVPDDE